MKQCFGYVRVSTLKQGDGVSLDEQKDAILEYAARKGLSVSKWWEERETAAKQGRPVFNQMVAALKRRQALGLIVHKIDRSARNYHDWADINDLADSGINLHVATESFDFNTCGGRMAADFMAVVAANYVRNLKQEIKKGQLGQLKRGILPWAAPIGYKNNGPARLKTPDPATASLVQQAFELYASGEYSLRGLVDEMAKRGLKSASGKPLRKGGFEKMLSNPFYCGIIKIRRTGQTFPGAHKPLITQAVFQRVQDVKSGKAFKTKTRHSHLFRGLFQCALCSKSMVGEWQKGRVYYRCHTPACPTMSIREDQVEARIIEILRTLNLSSAARRKVEAGLQAYFAEDTIENDIQTVQLQLGQVEQRLGRLTDILLDGLIDQAAFEAKKEALLNDRERLRNEASRLESAALNPSRVAKFLELVTSLAELYENAAKAEKRRIVEWATSNRSARGKSLCFEPSEWLSDTQEMLSVRYCAQRRPKTRTFASRELLERTEAILKGPEEKKPRCKLPRDAKGRFAAGPEDG